MVIVLGTDTLESAEQNWKANLPIERTESGIISFCREVHDENAASPISLTEEGMTMFDSEEHP